MSGVAVSDGALTGARAKVHVAYIGLTGLLILGIWLAFALAGYGVFALSGRNVTDLDKQAVLDAHRAVGSILGTITLLVLVTGLIARANSTLIGSTVALFLLAAIGQPVFAGIGDKHSWGGALHVVNAGVVLVLAFYCHLAARKVQRA